MSEVDDIGAGVSRNDGECGPDECTSDQYSSSSTVHAVLALHFDNSLRASRCKVVVCNRDYCSPRRVDYQRLNFRACAERLSHHQVRREPASAADPSRAGLSAEPLAVRRPADLLSHARLALPSCCELSPTTTPGLCETMTFGSRIPFAEPADLRVSWAPSSIHHHMAAEVSTSTVRDSRRRTTTSRTTDSERRPASGQSGFPSGSAFISSVLPHTCRR